MKKLRLVYPNNHPKISLVTLLIMIVVITVGCSKNLPLQPSTLREANPLNGSNTPGPSVPPYNPPNTQSASTPSPVQAQNAGSVVILYPPPIPPVPSLNSPTNDDPNANFTPSSVPTHTQMFITKLFQLLLKRSPEDSGLAYYASLLGDLPNPNLRGSVVDILMGSQEYLEGLVNNSYLRILVKNPDSATMAAGRALLAQGITIPDFFGILINTPEYKLNTISRFNGQNGCSAAFFEACFVQALYIDLFGWPADSGGIQYWSGHLNAGNISPTTLVNHFTHAEFSESSNFFQNEIRRAYRMILNRSIQELPNGAALDDSNFEIGYWYSQFLHQGISLKSFLKALYQSDEFWNGCKP